MHLQSPLRHMAAKPTTSLTDAELQLVLAEAIGEAESPQAPDPTNIAGLWNVAGHRGIVGAQREATGEGEARTRLGGGAEAWHEQMHQNALSALETPRFLPAPAFAGANPRKVLFLRCAPHCSPLAPTARDCSPLRPILRRAYTHTCINTHTHTQMFLYIYHVHVFFVWACS